MASRKSDPYWYPRHYKDYMQDTSHLSMIEHGAYTLLLDLYYMAGKPLIANGIALGRQLRCISDEEKEAMNKVLEEFFVLKNGLWHNARADLEITERNQTIEKRKKSSIIGNEKRWKNYRKSDPTCDPKWDPKWDAKCDPTVDPDTDTDTDIKDIIKKTKAKKERQVLVLNDDVIAWGEKQNVDFKTLEKYAEWFKDYVSNRKTPYQDEFAAFRNCVTADWPKFQKKGFEHKTKLDVLKERHEKLRESRSERRVGQNEIPFFSISDDD